MFAARVLIGNWFLLPGKFCHFLMISLRPKTSDCDWLIQVSGYVLVIGMYPQVLKFMISKKHLWVNKTTKCTYWLVTLQR